MRYTVWSSPSKTQYQTSVCSSATVFSLVVVVLSLVCPLLVAYRSQGFWIRLSNYQEQPDIHFRQEMIVLLEMKGGGSVGWSTFPTFNQMMETVRIPVVKSREEDDNRDGILDELWMEVQVPLDKGEEVTGAKMMLLMDYKLHRFSSLHMTGLLYLFDRGDSGTRLDISGDVSLVQKHPLAHTGRNTVHKASPVPRQSAFPADYRLATILADYQARNVSIRPDNVYSVWGRGRGVERFTLEVRMKYPLQTVQYTPGFWQVIKWGWVQYVALLAVSLAFFNYVNEFVFSRQVLPTTVLK